MAGAIDLEIAEVEEGVKSVAGFVSSLAGSDAPPPPDMFDDIPGADDGSAPPADDPGPPPPSDDDIPF
jgi:hypothetical protein